MSTIPRRSLLGAAAVAPAALLGLSACSDDAAAGGTTLRVGELGAVAVTQELFKAAGLDQDLPYAIEWATFVNAGPEYIEAAGADAVDVGLTADTPLIFAAAGGIGLKAIAVSSPGDPAESDNAILAAPGSGIASLEDLKGRKVSFQEGTITQYHTVKALESVGLSLADIEPVNLPVTDAVNSLGNGDIDAIATLGIYWTQAEAAGAEVIVTGSGLIPGNSLVSAREAAVADPDLKAAIEDYLDRLAQAQQWREEHVDEWAEIYGGLTGLPTDLVAATEERAASVIGPLTAEVVSQQQDQSDVYASLGIIEAQDAADQFDPSFNGVFGAPTSL
ncbi:ABC transporter substrate-binding protein [Glycomyces sp. NPDC048151]|uniref:ABC transporter substrate-binding protein n=1 Tax=Glycomyces sp. NPDC048151 TaxID=3364002 RepID=UPI0037145A06